MRYVDTHECIQRLVHHKVGIVGPKQLHSYMQATHLVKIPSIAHVCEYIFCYVYFSLILHVGLPHLLSEVSKSKGLSR